MSCEDAYDAVEEEDERLLLEIDVLHSTGRPRLSHKALGEKEKEGNRNLYEYKMSQDKGVQTEVSHNNDHCDFQEKILEKRKDVGTIEANTPQEVRSAPVPLDCQRCSHIPAGKIKARTTSKLAV